MLINLWNDKELTQCFMQIFNISENLMKRIISRQSLNNEEPYIVSFCEETGTKLDSVNYTNNLVFLGKIVSTTIDNLNCIKKHGLVPVDFLLENDSPLSSFLKKYHITITPSKHEFTYKNHHFYIPSYNEDCKQCIFGDVECRYSSFNYKDLACEYYKAVQSLSTRLYSHKSQIEMFLYASNHDMLTYSTVNRFPEILINIENLILKGFGTPLNLGNEWKEQKQCSYIVTLPINYTDMSYREGYISGSDGDAFSLLSQYGDYCEKTYYYPEEVPTCFWDNIWLLNTCLNRICYPDMSVGYMCAGMKHNVFIPYDKLDIEIV